MLGNSGEGYKQSLPLYRILLTTVLPSAVLPVGIATLFNMYLDKWRWINEPFHSFVESVGSFAAVVLSGFIIIMRRNKQLSPSYLWVACTLMGMGLLDGFHAGVASGPTFVWLHSLATFVGGLTFALIVLPDRISELSWLQNAPYLMAFLSVLLGTFSILFPESVPDMAKIGVNNFSFTAELMNITGGIGFLIAWCQFYQRTPENFSLERTLLANHCLLFGMAALLFHFSFLWDATWWLWHMLRLLAYIIILLFFFNLYNKKVEKLCYSQRELKKRTLELEHTQRHLSDIIEYSPTAITLKDRAGKFIIVNRKFSDLFAHSQKQLIGKTATDLFPADTAQQQHDEDVKVIKLGKATEVEEKYCHLTEEKSCHIAKGTKTFIVDRFPLKGSNNEIYGVGTVMTDISERNRVETERKKLITENAGRIKELNCLYGLSRLAEHADTALTHILKEMAELIASSWQHADYAGARIIIDDYETTSDTFDKTPWIQEAPVMLNGETRGFVQVCYSRKFPDADEGPFQKEERHLLNEIAVRVGNIIQRKNADLELRKTLEFNNKIIEEFPVGLSVYNRAGECIAINTCMKKITGFSQKQQLCSNYNEIDYWLDTGLCTAAKQSIALHTNICHNFEIEDASGKQNFFKGIFVPFMLRDEQRLLLMIEDVTERKKAEDDLKAALLEKESLLKEIHHRVKNNMQIVASLMFLQAQSIKNQEALDILQESQDRVKSMGLVHELLYQSGNLSKVPFKEYVEILISSLRQAYGAHDVLFQIEAESIDLPVDTAVPCGLIVNELITNSLKHAFQNKKGLETGILTIRFIRKNKICLLSVSDNGSGFPTDYDWGVSNTLGLHLIRTLASQLDGDLQFENQGGLLCQLRFSA